MPRCFKYFLPFIPKEQTLSHESVKNVIQYEYSWKRVRVETFKDCCSDVVF